MKNLQKEYKVGERTFLFDEVHLRNSYKKYKNYSDVEFLNNIVDILHFTVYVCWLKEVPSDKCLADDGIVHEIVHLLQENTIKHSNLQEIRKNFNKNLII